MTILKQCNPAPVNFDYVVKHPNLAMLKPERQEVLEEWNYLINQRFISEVEGSGKEYVRISDNGLNQINREGDLDQRIWGVLGL